MPKNEPIDLTKEPRDVKRVAATEGVGSGKEKEPIEMAPTSGPRNLDKLPFFEMLAQLTAREWEDRMVYLYRQNKDVIKQDPKDANYIERISHAFDEQYVKGKFGGGQFLAILKNTRINGAERKHSFRIEGEPVIQEGEVQIKKRQEQQNGQSGEVKSLLDTMQVLVDRVIAANSKNNGAEQEAITKSVAMLSEASRGALQIQQDAIKSSIGSTTGNPITDKFMEAMIARMAGGEKTDDLERMVKLMALMKQLNPEQSKPGLLGIVSELKALGEVAKDLGIKIGGGDGTALADAAGGGMDWKTALAAGLPTALQAVTGWVQEWQKANAERNRLMQMQLDAMRRGQIPPQQLPAATQPVQATAPAPAPAAIAPPPPPATSALPANFAAANPSAAEPPADTKVVEFPQQQQPNAVQVDLSFVAGLVRRSFDKGDPGDLAAIVIKRLFPDEQLKEFLPYFNDVEGLKLYCAMDPQLAEIMEDTEFPEFLNEFVKEMKASEEESAAETEPAPETPA